MMGSMDRCLPCEPSARQLSRWRGQLQWGSLQWYAPWSASACAPRRGAEDRIRGGGGYPRGPMGPAVSGGPRGPRVRITKGLKARARPPLRARGHRGHVHRMGGIDSQTQQAKRLLICAFEGHPLVHHLSRLRVDLPRPPLQACLRSCKLGTCTCTDIMRPCRFICVCMCMYECTYVCMYTYVCTG